MKLVKTVDAIGNVLCHDITRIVRGQEKGPAFRKGHVIKEQDIPLLLDIGKEHIYIWEFQEGMVHEDDAAEVLCEICKGANIGRSEVKEGKIELRALAPGLFKTDKEKLSKINRIGQIIIAARHGNTPVGAGDILAGVRVVPLMIEQTKLEIVRDIHANAPIMSILPYIPKKAGIITTGSEVFHGRIEDTFTAVIIDKLLEYGVETVKREVLSDEQEKITNACKKMISDGMDLVICTGGMSVDPDDRTPQAIRNTGAKVISHGAPVLPGSMFMLAYYEHAGINIPIVGLPACAMYSKRTIFDLILPRILADDPISMEDISLLGQGGLCLSCPQCVFPNCGFGKGS